MRVKELQKFMMAHLYEGLCQTEAGDGPPKAGSGVSTLLSSGGQQKAGTGVLEANFFKDFRMIDGFLAQ